MTQLIFAALKAAKRAGAAALEAYPIDTDVPNRTSNTFTGTAVAFARAGFMPSRVSTYSNAYFKDDPSGAEMRGWTTYAREHGRIGRTPSDFNKLSEELAKAIQSVLVQGTDPKQALDAAAAAYNAGK